MAWRQSPRTRKLASARLEFSADRRLRTALHAASLAALILAGLATAAWLYSSGRVPAARLAALERENASLQAELARARTDLEFERSTRAALTSQVAELSQRAGDLKNQVDFFNKQSGRSAGSR
jgi:septal ring factor EnvC (AmiA/AmiB activator)